MQHTDVLLKLQQVTRLCKITPVSMLYISATTTTNYPSTDLHTQKRNQLVHWLHFKGFLGNKILQVFQRYQQLSSAATWDWCFKIQTLKWDLFIFTMYKKSDSSHKSSQHFSCDSYYITMRPKNLSWASEALSSFIHKQKKHVYSEQMMQRPLVLAASNILKLSEIENHLSVCD